MMPFFDPLLEPKVAGHWRERVKGVQLGGFIRGDMEISTDCSEQGETAHTADHSAEELEIPLHGLQ